MRPLARCQWHPPRTVYVLACVLLTSAAVAADPPPGLPQSTPDGILLKNDLCRYEIGINGRNRALVNLADKKDYARPDVPFMLAGRGQQSWPASRVELHGDSLIVSFAGCDALVKAKVEIRPEYFTLTVTDVSGGELDWLQLCNLQATMTANVGSLVNAAWDEHFALCVLACNDQTDCG